MRVFRIARRRYPPDNSEGARLAGGRWNRPGTPVLYAAASKSLATVEVIAHRGGIAVDHQVIVIDIPEDVAIETLGPEYSAENWSAASPNEDTAALGSRWAAGLTAAVLRVPSAIYADEANYVLNPLHPDFARIRFEVSPEDIDQRLQTTEAAP